MLSFKLGNCRYTQYCAAIVATLTAASAGMYSTWPSPSLPKLTSDDSPIGVTITNEQGSWVASVFVLSMAPSAPFIALLVGKLGPKRTLLLSAIPSFIGWIMCVFAKSVTVLIVARLIGGFGGAISIAVVPQYIGEISSKEIRGRLGAIFNVLKLTGSLFVLSVGPFVSYNALTWSCSAVSVVFAVSFCFMPESPFYLIRKGDTTKAEHTLRRLMLKSTGREELKKELSAIQNLVESDFKKSRTMLSLITENEYRKSLLIILGIKTVQQFSGFNAIEAYLQTIINSSNSNISSEISSIISGFVQIPTAIVAAILVDRLGRKPLFITSALTCALALIAEGLYFHLQIVEGCQLPNARWLPTTALLVYLIMNPIGLFSIPYVLMGELFATNVKDAALAVSMGYGGLIAFLATKFFNPIADAWGMYTVFWIFAGFCILGSVFTYVVVPETKGKTFCKIQEEIKQRSCFL